MHAFSELYARTGRGAEGRARRPARRDPRHARCRAARQSAGTRLDVVALDLRPRDRGRRRRATAESFWMHVRRGEGNTPLLPTLGHYQDDLVRETAAGVQLRRVTRLIPEEELLRERADHAPLRPPRPEHPACLRRRGDVRRLVRAPRGGDPGDARLRRRSAILARPGLARAAPRRAPASSRLPPRGARWADRRARRSRQAGELEMPDWFGEIRFTAYSAGRWRTELASPTTATSCSAIRRGGSTPTSTTAGTTRTPARTSPRRASRPWRYELTPAIEDPDGPHASRHGAFYEVTGDLPALRAALTDTLQARRVDIPDWMAEGSSCPGTASRRRRSSTHRAGAERWVRTSRSSSAGCPTTSTRRSSTPGTTHTFPRSSRSRIRSAQRYRLEPVVVDEDAGVRYRYLALYEIEGDTRAAGGDGQSGSWGARLLRGAQGGR